LEEKPELLEASLISKIFLFEGSPRSTRGFAKTQTKLIPALPASHILDPLKINNRA